MSKKSKNESGGMVYSTNPDFSPQNDSEDEYETLIPSQQSLLVQKSTKHRAGKVVTLVLRFIGTDADLESLSKTLKSKLGIGGTSKEGEIILQGDVKEKCLEILLKLGYKAKLGN